MSDESEMSTVIRYTAITIGILSILTVLAVGSIMCGEYKSTHGPEYETGYENGYSDGMIEHVNERYVLCKEYIEDADPLRPNPRMMGYSEGYVDGYEEWVSR